MTTLILLVIKMKDREVKEVAQGHAAGKWYCQDSSPGSLALGTTHFVTVKHCL